MLAEFGEIAELQRLAGLERYGLSKSEMVDAKNMRITVQANAAESMDREATRWFQGQTMHRVARIQGQPPDPKYVEELLNKTSGVHDRWFIRCEGHEELIECFRDRAMIDVLGCAESKALAHDEAGRSLNGARSTWRRSDACSITLPTPAASRLWHRFPKLSLRNLLMVPVLQNDAKAE